MTMVYPVWGGRINPSIVQTVKDYCRRNNIKIQAFLETSLVNELQKRGRYVKAKRNAL